MVAFLAWRNLLRNRTRTLLLWLGISVSGALLYDMVMLSGGLESSFGTVLREMNLDLRITPRGSLPFSADVNFHHASGMLSEIRRDPRVAVAHGFYGTTLYWTRPDGRSGSALVPAQASPQPAFALGVEGPAPEVFHTRSGAMRQTPGAPALWISSRMAARAGVSVGDTLVIGGPPGEAVERITRSVRLPVGAIGDLRFETSTQSSFLLPLNLARSLRGVEADDPFSLLTLNLRSRADVPAVARDLRARFPQADVYTIPDLLRRVRGQLSYFTQFSAVLGTMSFFVAWLLISTLLVLSLNDRVGEMAVLRAVGLKPARLVGVMLAESLAFVLISVPSGLLLGLLTARRLDRLLMSGPGLPADLHFFVATPAATVQTVALLVLAGLLGAIYPMARVARLPIAATLHESAT